MFTAYVVRPREDGDGYSLTGPDLPYPLWYEDEILAGGMGHHLGRTTGGRVIYLDSTGYAFIAETIEVDSRVRH